MRAPTVSLVVLAVVITLMGPSPGLSPARAASAATHPLEPLSPKEFERTYALVRASFASRGLPTGALLFSKIALNEPPKAVVRAWSAGQTFPRDAAVHISGRQVSWQGWRFYAVLSPREGLVLYDVRYDDQARSRPIAYRLALSEIYVPYGVPDRNWVFRSALDVGEYNLGTTAQTLEVDRDVPANARSTRSSRARPARRPATRRGRSSTRRRWRCTSATRESCGRAPIRRTPCATRAWAARGSTTSTARRPGRGTSAAPPGETRSVSTRPTS